MADKPHKVVIKNADAKGFADVELDGKLVRGLVALDAHLRPGRHSIVRLSFVGEVELDGDILVEAVKLEPPDLSASGGLASGGAQ